MLSWQRISALARKSPGPLFFFGETEAEEPVVVLSLHAYEALLVEAEDEKSPATSFLRHTEVSQGTEQAIQVPIRIETVETRLSSEDVRHRPESPSPDLLKGSNVGLGATPHPSPLTAPTPSVPKVAAVTPSSEGVQSLEERFYFAAPLENETGLS